MVPGPTRDVKRDAAANLYAMGCCRTICSQSILYN